MAITLDNVKKILLSRCQAKMAVANMDGGDLNDPISWALRKMDIYAVDPTNVTDSDLSSVMGADYDKLFDLAELRTLENVSGNMAYSNISIGPRSEQLAQLSDQVDKAIDRLTAKIQKSYGIGFGVMSAGSISLDFMEKRDDDD